MFEIWLLCWSVVFRVRILGFFGWLFFGYLKVVVINFFVEVLMDLMVGKLLFDGEYGWFEGGYLRRDR